MYLRICVFLYLYVSHLIHGNVMFISLNPKLFKNIAHVGSFKHFAFVYVCKVCSICSVYWTLNEIESELWMYIGRIAPNLKNLKNWPVYAVYVDKDKLKNESFLQMNRDMSSMMIIDIFCDKKSWSATVGGQITRMAFSLIWSITSWPSRLAHGIIGQPDQTENLSSVILNLSFTWDNISFIICSFPVKIDRNLSLHYHNLGDCSGNPSMNIFHISNCSDKRLRWETNQEKLTQQTCNQGFLKSIAKIFWNTVLIRLRWMMREVLVVLSVAWLGSHNMSAAAWIEPLKECFHRDRPAGYKSPPCQSFDSILSTANNCEICQGGHEGTTTTFMLSQILKIFSNAKDKEEK